MERKRKVATAADVSSLEERLHLAEDAVCAMRCASNAILGGNCAFVDDDAAMLAAYAKWAIDNGCPRDINPAITDKARGLYDVREENARLKAAFRAVINLTEIYGEAAADGDQGDMDSAIADIRVVARAALGKDQ